MTKILIIEAHLPLQATLTQALKTEYECRNALSPREALRLVRSESFEAVLCSDDIRETDDGEALWETLSRDYPATAIILMHDQDEAADLPAEMRARAAGFLSKPFGLEELRETVRQALG